MSRPMALHPTTGAVTAPIPLAAPAGPPAPAGPAPAHPAVVAVAGFGVVLVMMQSSGGFRAELLGPDVLLAVAGFLTTRTLLLGALSTGRMPLGAWYRRQFLRRAPLLVLTVGAMVALSAVSSPPEQAAPAGADAVAGVLSLGNWWDLGGDGVTADGPSRIDPLGLLWLIGLLVQLALVWPLLLAPLRRLVRADDARRVLVALVPVLIAVAFTAWLVGPSRAAAGAGLPELALGTHVRATEWLAGAAAAATAVGLRDRLPAGPAWPATALAAVGLAVLAGTGVAATLDPEQWLRLGGPGGAAAGAAVLLLSIQLAGDGPLARALGRGLPAELGRAAYPLLVLHLPVYRIIETGVPAVRPAALLLVGGALTWLIGLVLYDGLLGRLAARRPVGAVVLVVVTAAAVVAGGTALHRTPPVAPDTTAGPRVLVLGGSVAQDMAAALTGSQYAVTEDTRPGCGLLPGAPALATPARLSAQAQLPGPPVAPCGGWQRRWRDLVTAERPAAVLLDLSGDAGPGRNPCDAAFRARYRPLLAEAATILSAGSDGGPVLVADARQGAGEGPGRCLQALIAEAVAARGALVPLDIDALLCPDAICPPLRDDTAHLTGSAIDRLRPRLAEAVTVELDPARSATRAGR